MYISVLPCKDRGKTVSSLKRRVTEIDFQRKTMDTMWYQLQVLCISSAYLSHRNNAK